MNKNNQSLATLIHKLTKYQSFLTSATDTNKIGVYKDKIGYYTGQLNRSGVDMDVIKQLGGGHDFVAVNNALQAKKQEIQQKFANATGDNSAIQSKINELKNLSDEAKNKYVALNTAHDELQKEHKNLKQETVKFTNSALQTLNELSALNVNVTMQDVNTNAVVDVLNEIKNLPISNNNDLMNDLIVEEANKYNNEEHKNVDTNNVVSLLKIMENKPSEGLKTKLREDFNNKSQIYKDIINAYIPEQQNA